MAARKGTRPPAAGKGRKRGVPNKVTGVARELFAQFLDANAPKVQRLFDRVARKDPAKALELLTRFAEYAIPKLARTEVKNDGLSLLPMPPGTQINFPDGGPGCDYRLPKDPVEALRAYQRLMDWDPTKPNPETRS
jgi:hypothetical protein